MQSPTKRNGSNIRQARPPNAYLQTGIRRPFALATLLLLCRWRKRKSGVHEGCSSSKLKITLTIDREEEKAAVFPGNRY